MLSVDLVPNSRLHGAHAERIGGFGGARRLVMQRGGAEAVALSISGGPAHAAVLFFLFLFAFWAAFASSTFCASSAIMRS